MFPKRSKQWPRGCWPNETQQLLLQACFLPDDADAMRAWDEWQRRVPWDFIDGSSLRLLLFLYQRLRHLGREVPDLPRLAGLVRHHWVQTQLMRRDTVAVLKLFQEEKLATMLLKGAALNATVYPEGLRPMADIDLVVRNEQFDAALALLGRHGWTPAFNRRRIVRQGFHACHLVKAGASDVDLHWDFFHERFCSDDERDAFWSASREIELGGAATRVLCPADQLLGICEHGMRHDELPPLRWLADAHRIVQVQGDQIDWQRCARIARRHGLSLSLVETLRYLEQHLGQLIPSAAWRSLDGMRIPLRDRVAHAIVTRRMPGSHPFWYALPRHLLAYSRLRQSCPGLCLGEYVRAANYIEMPLGRCLRHFTRLAAATLRIRVRDTLRAIRDRCVGRSRSWLSPATARRESLEGFHAPERLRRVVFRWTQPNATLRVKLTPGDYQVTMHVLPVREIGRCGLRILWNRTVMPCEPEGNKAIRFRLQRDAFADYPEQRLVIGCTPWNGAVGDPRSLGLPLVSIEFERLEHALPEPSRSGAWAA